MELLKSAIFQIAVFGTACYVLSFILRRVVEATFPSLKRDPKDDAERKPFPHRFARVWNEVLLYCIPPMWGVGLAMMLRKTDVLPDDFRSWRVAIVYGIAFGFLSGLLYKVLKRLIAKAADLPADVVLPGDSVPPSPSATDKP